MKTISISIQDLGDRLRTVQAPKELSDLLTEAYLPSLGIERICPFDGGRSVSVVPATQTIQGGALILGAYPTATFERKIRHIVPVNNIDEPFDPKTESGKELDECYLALLGLERKQCWITNLVKVFLFKENHVGSRSHANQSLARSNFEQLASSEENLDWLAAELKVASPKVVITLGREVAGIIRGITGDRRRNDLLSGSLHEFGFRGTEALWAHLPHPGIVMRKNSKRNTWPTRHEDCCMQLRESIRDVLTAQL